LYQTPDRVYQTPAFVAQTPASCTKRQPSSGCSGLSGVLGRRLSGRHPAAVAPQQTKEKQGSAQRPASPAVPRGSRKGRFEGIGHGGRVSNARSSASKGFWKIGACRRAPPRWRPATAAQMPPKQAFRSSRRALSHVGIPATWAAWTSTLPDRAPANDACMRNLRMHASSCKNYRSVPTDGACRRFVATATSPPYQGSSKRPALTIFK